MSRLDRSGSGMAALWLGLVEQRCLKIAAGSASPSMAPAERVALLDAAMGSGDAAAYLDAVQRAFEDGDCRGDAVMAAVLRALIRAGEIETVMRMRAEWMGRRPPAQPRPGRST